VGSIRPTRLTDRLGGKGDGLRWLAEHGYRVPATFVVPWRDRQYSPDDLAGVVAAECDPGTRYAVRSSANLEDAAVRSFAGQFRTELDVPFAAVADAIGRVLASAATGQARAYLAAAGIDPDAVAMAVVVQEMVDATAAGVAFSRNPMTGLSEVVIEAVAGRGDALVAGGVTPDRWVVRWGDAVESPRHPSLPNEVVMRVAASVAAMAGEHGSPVDVEWAWDGERVHWLQVRPITALDDVPIYSNRIAREVLPGIVKPLVWSVNVPVVNAAWIDLFAEAVGPTDLRPEDLAASFAYRAYFNMGTIGRIFEQLGMPRDSLELLLGFPNGTEQPGFAPTLRTVRLLPRMAALVRDKLRYETELTAVLPDLRARFDAVAAVDPTTLDDAGLLDLVAELRDVTQQAAYANIVTPLLMSAYHGALRAVLRRRGVDPETLDVTVGLERLVHFDPAAHLDRLHGEFLALDEETAGALAHDGYAALQRLPGDHSFRRAFEGFLDRFGHFSDSGNDFSAVPWREDPDHVIDLVRRHVPGRPRAERTTWADVAPALDGATARVAGSLHERARRFRHHREAVSYHYTYGYGLFRDLYLEAGRRLADRGVVDDVDGVFYLTADEVEAGLAGRVEGAAQLVAQRRGQIEEVRDADLPETIFGDRFEPLPPAGAVAGVLRGIPTSRGVYRGRARVVPGRDRFGAVERGDVIVIPFSDVGWTPLFARAGAVVAEAGGMLSHSSIVAREYGVPCVVSVPGATRIEDGAEVVVDGYAGTVTIVSEAGTGPG
jgi:phosphohistidine swiveling domain-containing protein